MTENIQVNLILQHGLGTCLLLLHCFVLFVNSTACQSPFNNNTLLTFHIKKMQYEK